MRYSDDVIEDIRQGNDIIEIINEYTSLKQRGSSFIGLCPFHKETTPSFSVSPDKQLYHCFGCGASGTVYNFIMNIENYDFLDAVKYLADRINYVLPSFSNFNDYDKNLEIKNKLYEIHKVVARKFYDNLFTNQGKIAKEYLDKRKILPNIRNKFGIGYSLFKRNDIYKFLKEKNFDDDIILKSGIVIRNKNGEFFDRFFGRLMFPIIDVQGRIIGFGGRDLTSNKNTAKYLNSPDTLIFNKSYNLYGINFARCCKSKEIILVEGYIDVIALYQVGIHNVVASLGTAFNENHTKVLKKYFNKVIIIFDSDDAGTKATLRAIPVLVNNSIDVRVLQLKKAKDPDEYISKFGVSNFIELLNNSKGYISFQIEQKLKEYNVDDPIQKVEFTKEASKIISKLISPIERDVFIKEVCVITNISYEAIVQEIKNLSNESINFYKTKYNKPKKISEINRFEEARQSMLFILSNNINVYNKIKHYLKPEDFIDKVYIKLAELIYNANEESKRIYPAEVILKFNDQHEQQKISKIFMLKFDFSETDQLEKVVNDQFKVIKEGYFNVKLRNCMDTNIQKLLEEKKFFDKVYINI